MANGSLLIFSDVHLGSDLNDAGPVARRSAAIDRDLVRLLAHYRRERPPQGTWTIVIAGDFIDFVGMAIDPHVGEELATPLTPEEREHGVGNAEDHARLKLARVAERHADVFAELGRFVADGHALTILHGNHDIEFHWDGVKDDFRRLLLEARAREARATGEPLEVDDAFDARIAFSPWFFYRDRVVYIEHGHHYDPFCATAFPMVPLSPLDPRRMARAFSDVLLRFVVRRTRGMKEHGHENMGLASYVQFGLGLGASGMIALGRRFARSVAELFRIRRAYLGGAARALRAENERRIARFSEASQVGLDRLAQLLALQAQPITSTVRGILGSVLLDRLAVGLAAVGMVGVLGVVRATGRLDSVAWPAITGIVAAWAAAHVVLSRQRNVDPAEQLARRAVDVARLFPAAFVVMGHTHVPTTTTAGDATYINLGSWAEEAPEEGPGGKASASTYRAARTHLVIHERDGQVEARFCEWNGDDGPRLLSRV